MRQRLFSTLVKNISPTKMLIFRCLELLCGRCHYPSLLRRRWETHFFFTFFNQENISNLIVSYLPHHIPPSHQFSFFFHQPCPPSYDCSHYVDERIFTNLFFVQQLPRGHHNRQSFADDWTKYLKLINISNCVFLPLIL